MFPSFRERWSLCPGSKSARTWKNHSFSPSLVGLLHFSTGLPFLPVDFDMVLFTFPWLTLGQQDFSPARTASHLCEVRRAWALDSPNQSLSEQRSGDFQLEMVWQLQVLCGTWQFHMGWTISTFLSSKWLWKHLGLVYVHVCMVMCVHVYSACLEIWSWAPVQQDLKMTVETTIKENMI
jgi:hypothetical protein